MSLGNLSPGAQGRSYGPGLFTLPEAPTEWEDRSVEENTFKVSLRNCINIGLFIWAWLEISSINLCETRLYLTNPKALMLCYYAACQLYKHDLWKIKLLGEINMLRDILYFNTINLFNMVHLQYRASNSEIFNCIADVPL